LLLACIQGAIKVCSVSNARKMSRSTLRAHLFVDFILVYNRCQRPIQKFELVVKYTDTIVNDDVWTSQSK
jgi:hypothetical protein